MAGLVLWLQTQINTSCKQTQQLFSTAACEEAACLPLSTVHQVCVGGQTAIFAFFSLLVCSFKDREHRWSGWLQVPQTT